MRDCERVGGKVVDHAEALEADITTEGFNRERPCMVCECDLVARYRRGHRQYGVSRPRRWRLLSQICVNRIGKRRVVVQCVYPRRGCGAVRLDQRETCVRGADISDQADLWHVHKMVSDAARSTEVFAPTALNCAPNPGFRSRSASIAACCRQQSLFTT